MNGIILKDVSVSELKRTVTPLVSFRALTLFSKKEKGKDVLVANVELRIAHDFETVSGSGRTLEDRELFLEKKSGDLTSGMEMAGEIIKNTWDFDLIGTIVKGRRIANGDLSLGFVATKVGPGSGGPGLKKASKKAKPKK